MHYMPGKQMSNLKWGKVRDRRGLVSRSTIRRTVDHIVEHFQPDKIILFGSYAYGCPNPESDVDLLVVMRARNELDQSLRIEETLDPPFPLDIIVRTPNKLHWRLAEGDWFLREVVDQGKLLYEKADVGMGAKGRGRHSSREKDLQGDAAAT
jgi:predicted nucleotidyltransferase